MTTWTLWLGALLVVGGSAALLKDQAVAARALWVLAVLAFAAAASPRVTPSESRVAADRWLTVFDDWNHGGRGSRSASALPDSRSVCAVQRMFRHV